MMVFSILFFFSVWQHIECMGISSDAVPENYLCDQCQPRFVIVCTTQPPALVTVNKKLVRAFNAKKKNPFFAYETEILILLTLHSIFFFFLIQGG